MCIPYVHYDFKTRTEKCHNSDIMVNFSSIEKKKMLATVHI